MAIKFKQSDKCNYNIVGKNVYTVRFTVVWIVIL